MSIINSLVPDFQENPIVSLKSAFLDMPAIEKCDIGAFSMDYHAINERNERLLLECQVFRHIKFDERALFYASRVYSNQFASMKNVKDSDSECWYEKLNRVYAIQILDYDSNRIRGIHRPNCDDELLKRVSKNPMQDGVFLKHYAMTDRFSGQEIDYLQMIQLELPRAERFLSLFPPTADLTIMQWWLSILKHAKEFTEEYVEKMHKEGIMPDIVYEGFRRMKYAKWNPGLQNEYMNSVEMRRIYDTQITMDLNEADERARAEGKAEGKAEGIAIEKRETALNAIGMGLTTEQIAGLTGLTVDEINSLKH
ncbi:hypothetical protein FACS189472_06690 [Alphaproteobacteria bacterium]|nr:hypothetical protein FACS189472_06690 [Alphaproteobacteria bacterium]